MKGDATNLTRVMLARLSVASALLAAVCFLVYLAGNFGSLSGQAIAVASYGMGGAGLAAFLFSIASFAATMVAPVAGARFSVSTLVIALCSGLFGLFAMLGAGISGAISRGLSF